MTIPSTSAPAEKPCRSGRHDRAEVGVASNGGCRGCRNAARRQRYALHQPDELAWGAAYRASHRTQEAARHAAYRRTLPGVLAGSRRYLKLLDARTAGKLEQIAVLEGLLASLTRNGQ
jgi:hypothetical protein